MGVGVKGRDRGGREGENNEAGSGRAAAMEPLLPEKHIEDLETLAS